MTLKSAIALLPAPTKSFTMFDNSLLSPGGTPGNSIRELEEYPIATRSSGSPSSMMSLSRRRRILVSLISQGITEIVKLCEPMHFICLRNELARLVRLDPARVTLTKPSASRTFIKFLVFLSPSPSIRESMVRPTGSKSLIARRAETSSETLYLEPNITSKNLLTSGRHLICLSLLA